MKDKISKLDQKYYQEKLYEIIDKLDECTNQELSRKLNDLSNASGAASMFDTEARLEQSNNVVGQMMEALKLHADSLNKVKSNLNL